MPHDPAPTQGPRLHTRRFETRAELEAALIERLAQAISSTTPGAIMLSGGSTPIPAYRTLASRSIRPRADLAIFFSDDRYVPSGSDGSNYHQTRPLLEALALPEERVLRVRSELPLQAAADDYEARLQALQAARLPLTLGLLGLGADGHTASLFRPEHIEQAQGHLAIAVHRPDGRDAISVTPALLAQIAEPLFIVAGSDKRTALKALLSADPNLVAWQAVAGCESVEVWAEHEAWPLEA